MFTDKSLRALRPRKTTYRVFEKSVDKKLPRPAHACRWDLFLYAVPIAGAPPARTKNKRGHLLPLTGMAIDLIDQVRALRGRKGLYLFPKYGDREKPGPMSRHVRSRNVQKLCADTGFTRFVPRDLRGTVKTRMGELGIAKDVRDRVQNRAATDVSAKHYDRYNYMAEKRAAA